MHWEWIRTSGTHVAREPFTKATAVSVRFPTVRSNPNTRKTPLTVGKSAAATCLAVVQQTPVDIIHPFLSLMPVDDCSSSDRTLTVQCHTPLRLAGDERLAEFSLVTISNQFRDTQDSATIFVGKANNVRSLRHRPVRIRDFA